MQNLPNWMLLNPLGSIYDTESATPLEMTAKLYGAMQALITEYNATATELNKMVLTFNGSTATEVECFKKAMESRLRTKFEELNLMMAAIKTDLTKYAQSYMAENMPDGVLPVVTSADDGKILAVVGGAWGAAFPAFTYDPETESLTFNIPGGE